MATSWEEIKKLAAEFQTVQLHQTSYKLSERNCIEIINMLIKAGHLDVVHTIDGKEFVTKEHLRKEISDELYVHGGRINIVELQSLLNVDVSYIDAEVGEIVKNDPNVCLVLGQIISKDYMNKMAEEVNELMQEKGSISLTELTNLYELPLDFINQIIEPRMKSIIKGNYDGKIIYTHEYVDRQKALLSGALEAIIKPIRISHLIKELNLNASTVFEVYDELIANKQILGTLLGGKQESTAVFVPAIYTRNQKQYIDSFFKQNGYIDFSTIRNAGVNDPLSYLKSLFVDQKIIFASSCCFSSFFFDRIEQDVEECLNRTGFCDITQLVPSNLTQKDSNMVTVMVKDSLNSSIDMELMNEIYLVKKDFLKALNAKFQAKMEEKASEDLKSPNVVLSIRTEHAAVSTGDKTTSSSSSSLSKSKSKSKVNKKGGQLSEQSNSSEENIMEINFIDRANLVKQLKSFIAELPDDLVESMVEYFLRPLNVQYFDLLRTKIENGLVVHANADTAAANQVGQLGATASSSGALPPKKNTMKEIQEKIKTFLLNARVFDKALKSIQEAKVQDLISKHLIKTICTDILNDMVKFLADEQLIQYSEENFTNEIRNKLIQKFKEPHKKRFADLNVALTNKTSTEVIDLIEKAADSFELSIKKADSKKEKEIVLQLREATKASLEAETDPATILHLVATLLHYHATGQILNAPGRCVPNILETIRSHLKEDTFQQLQDYQRLVIETISKNKTDPTLGETISVEKSNEIRLIGLDAKNHIIASSTSS